MPLNLSHQKHFDDVRPSFFSPVYVLTNDVAVGSTPDREEGLLRAWSFGKTSTQKPDYAM